MDRSAAQLVVRELITETDQLSRLAFSEDDLRFAEHFAALRTSLERLDRRLGANAPRFGVAGEIDLLYQRLLALAATAPSGERDRLALLVTHASRLRPARVGRARVSRARRFARKHGAALGLVGGGAAAIAAVGIVPLLRRSRSAWAAAVTAVVASIGAALALERDALSFA